MTDKQFKIRVTDKRTGKVVSYFKISDTDTHSYDLYTGYQDINGKEIYTNDEINFIFNGGGDIEESGIVSKNILEIDFMAIDERGTGYPLVHMKQMLKANKNE